jgi:NADH-quinone oxidoreductase subunit M
MPTPRGAAVGSVILAGVLLKMGTYGLLRIAVGILPDGARAVAPVLGVLAVAAIIIGGLVCLAQTELKRLIAYSSVGHMGFVLLGIATLTATGFQAALIGNIAHGVITGLLFFLAGAIKDRAHTGVLADLGGLREVSPRLSGVLAFAAIASLGLPGLAGFWGEAFAVVASFSRGGALWVVLAVVAAVGAALAAAYFLRLLRLVTHGSAAPRRGVTPAASGRWAVGGRRWYCLRSCSDSTGARHRTPRSHGPHRRGGTAVTIDHIALVPAYCAAGTACSRTGRSCPGSPRAHCSDR